jgi:hypothetical protein
MFEREKMTKVHEGAIAPDFTLPDTLGQSVTLSDYRGAEACRLGVQPGVHVTVLPPAHGAVAPRVPGIRSPRC